MGVYLSTPNKEKVSEDHKNEKMKCGASSMQGWRVNQEDAHNCCLELTESTCLFGVYDGHGGREVALYTQDHFPEELKKNAKFQSGEYREALVETFLSFDKKLVEPDVVAELKKIMDPDDATPEAAGIEDDEDEDIGDLRKEATMPLDQLMQKYTKRLGEKDVPASPRLRAKRARGSSEAGCSSSSSEVAAGSSSSQPGPSSSAAGSSEANTDDNEAMPSDVTTTTAAAAADQSCTDAASSVDACSSSTVDVVNSEKVSAAGGSGESSVSSSSTRKSLAEKYSNGLVEEQDGTLDSSTDIKENGDGSNANEVDDDVVTSTNEKKPAKKIITAADLFKRFATGQQADDDDSSSDSDENFVGSDRTSSEDENEDADGEDAEDEDGEEEEDSEAGMDDEEDDEFSMRMSNEPGMDSGCTAVVALVLPEKILVANAGDSRCVASCAGKAVELSFDHKPEDEKELDRITKAGGRVSADGRVNGGLNLSRALGDHIYKAKADLPLEEQMISPLPDIQELSITPDLEFLVLACDGIWNSLSSQEVIDFVRPRLKAKPDKLSSVCEELFEHCLAENTMGDGTGCDNMTAIIVQFRPDQEIPDILLSHLDSTIAKEDAEVQYSKRAGDGSSDGSSEAKRSKTDADFPEETP